MLAAGPLLDAIERVHRQRGSSMQVAFDEPQLRIVLPGHDQMHAPLHTLKCMSACACNLPADATDWDLSGLLVDGQPVSLDIVKAWVGAVYKHLGDAQYGKELDDTSRSMEGLYQLLRFADAVGSRPGLLKACLAHVEALELQVPCDQGLATLIADGRIYSIGIGSQRMIVRQGITHRGETVATLAGNEAIAAVKQAVSQQVEQLLWLAYKLQAAPLITILHTFIHSSVTMERERSLLRGCLGSVLTPRVLEAALGARQATGARQWINSIVAQPAAIARESLPNEAWFLEPLEADKAAPAWQFKARLTRRALGLPAGTKVDVTLDIAGGTLKIGWLSFGVQLLLGPTIQSAEDEADLMGS